MTLPRQQLVACATPLMLSLEKRGRLQCFQGGDVKA